ncbi:hypothetical protein C8N35_104254 [Breoghania corrubedonensis]|uniref:Uncharacterized protein n=1 Tax=Breoghania corrubedonensis TaxID=665038 RepID=A0A2T5VA47_9HYPH|nr:hypothetical protein C8N35_104254 [Breoghania corrubedonensis]
MRLDPRRQLEFSLGRGRFSKASRPVQLVCSRLRTCPEPPAQPPRDDLSLLPSYSPPFYLRWSGRDSSPGAILATRAHSPEPRTLRGSRNDSRAEATVWTRTTLPGNRHRSQSCPRAHDAPRTTRRWRASRNPINQLNISTFLFHSGRTPGFRIPQISCENCSHVMPVSRSPEHKDIPIVRTCGARHSLPMSRMSPGKKSPGKTTAPVVNMPGRARCKPGRARCKPGRARCKPGRARCKDALKAQKSRDADLRKPQVACRQKEK